MNDTNNNRTHNSTNTKMLILAAIFTAVNVVCAQIQIPIAPAGFSGGFGIITGPTGGYIIGYIFTAFITGFIIDSYMAKPASGRSPQHKAVPPYPVLILAMIAGLAACYLLGTIWFIHLTGWTIGKALMTCVVVFLPGDALKIILAAILIRKLYPAASSFRAA